MPSKESENVVTTKDFYALKRLCELNDKLGLLATPSKGSVTE